MMRGIWSRFAQAITQIHEPVLSGLQRIVGSNETTSSDSTDPAPHAYEEAVQLATHVGFKEVVPVAHPTLMTRIRHFIFSCQPIAHWVMHKGMARPVNVGMICVVCWKEYPLNG